MSDCGAEAMRMSDLQADIDKWDALTRGDRYDPEMIVRIVDAAKRYANLDYKAGWHWAVRRQAMSLEFATGIINAALGITEDTE